MLSVGTKRILSAAGDTIRVKNFHELHTTIRGDPLDGKYWRLRRRRGFLSQLSRDEISRSTYRVGPKISKGNFPTASGMIRSQRTRLLQRTSENQARVYQSECQSSLRRGGKMDLYLLAFDIGGPCAMQFLSMDFYAKVSRRYLETHELNIYATQ